MAPLENKVVGVGAADGDDSIAVLPVYPLEVVVHPLVLLSIVDHYNRVAKDTKKRAVGVLLGTKAKGCVDVTNSFAVPFEEDLRNPSIWYLDHNFLESMYAMFKKVNAKERIMGFYSTGPKIRENDLVIAQLFKRFCHDPLYVIVDVRLGVEGIPTIAYRTKEEVEVEGKEIQTTFEHVPSSIGAVEAEEVGVEHLLRDINDPSVSTLANQIRLKMTALAGLRERLDEAQSYLKAVLAGTLPPNNQIIYQLQDMLNLLPNLSAEELVRSMLVKNNDLHFVIYLSALTRSIVALHDRVLNKIKYKDIDDMSQDDEEKKKSAKATAAKDKDKEKAISPKAASTEAPTKPPSKDDMDTSDGK